MYAAANNLDFHVHFGMSGRYKQPVQYRRESAHKDRAAWAVFSLGVCMRERQHIYEDLNESSSASPGGSQQLEILPSLNSKEFFSGPPVFPAAPAFPWTLIFHQAQGFDRRKVFTIRQVFTGRQYFCIYFGRLYFVYFLHSY